MASDATPIVEYTKKVVYLDDEEIAVIDLEEGLKLYWPMFFIWSLYGVAAVFDFNIKNKVEQIEIRN